MDSPQRMVTNLPKAQLDQSIRELEQSIEVDRVEIGHYQILEQMLAATSVRAIREPKAPMGVDFALREKDRVKGVLQGLVRMEYDEINGKQEVMSFLNQLLAYAT